MTMITPEQDVAESAEILRSLQAAIAELRREIESLSQQARSGEEIRETAMSKPLGQVSGLLAHCLKAENTLNECRNRRAGIARGSYALDLDRARAEIGCKLDRLRRCGNAGEVPE
ncbi:hypothetical protein ACFSUD_09915 [Sulfitobacter aestuarii]|uniref:Uncharacterized protein n=1 Tax=Sulfitobacter aestuarii TaxID=2161676 RepID=A0ABW5U4R9_9RHOB